LASFGNAKGVKTPIKTEFLRLKRRGVMHRINIDAYVFSDTWMRVPPRDCDEGG
jgi:hypothetical protein